jgi:hypothetical protein
MVGLATKEGRSLELELKAARLLRGVKNEKKNSPQNIVLSLIWISKS